MKVARVQRQPYKFKALDKLAINQVAVSYRDREEKLTYNLSLDHVSGSVPEDAPIKLTVQGGEMNNSTFAGDFGLDLKSDIPKLSGIVDVTRLDLKPITEVYAEDRTPGSGVNLTLTARHKHQPFSRVKRIVLPGPLGMVADGCTT